MSLTRFSRYVPPQPRSVTEWVRWGWDWVTHDKTLCWSMLSQWTFPSVTQSHPPSSLPSFTTFHSVHAVGTKDRRIRGPRHEESEDDGDSKWRTVSKRDEPWVSPSSPSMPYSLRSFGLEATRSEPKAGGGRGPVMSRETNKGEDDTGPRPPYPLRYRPRSSLLTSLVPQPLRGEWLEWG